MSGSYPLIVASLTETFRIPADLIAPDKSFQDLDLDSLALVELALVVGERTGIDLHELTAESTLAETAAFLDRAGAGSAAVAGPRPAR
ncbi:acyl carrier protein [Streptomyces sp. NPDC046215]|uniref:Carrier domain-containing protein n=1 Tax=Streptomyces stramineus TaxID=173861 RepID=A0ABP3KTT8_9ACTN